MKTKENKLYRDSKTFIGGLFMGVVLILLNKHLTKFGEVLLLY